MKIKFVKQKYEIRKITPENSETIVKGMFRRGWSFSDVGEDEDAEDQSDNFVALCENCLYPILEGEQFQSWADGVYLCSRCSEGRSGG